MDLLRPLDATNVAEHIARVRDEKIRELTDCADVLMEKAATEAAQRKDEAALMASCSPLAPQCKAVLVGELKTEKPHYYGNDVAFDVMLTSVGLGVVGMRRGSDFENALSEHRIFCGRDSSNRILPNAPRLEPDKRYRTVLFVIEEAAQA